MGLFGNNQQKELQKEEQLKNRMAIFGLDNLSSNSKDATQFIFKNYEYSVLSNFGNALTGDKQSIANEHLKTIIEQNWIIIKLLDDLLKK